MSNKRTMESLSYGFYTPADMLEKLERVGEKLTHPADKDDIFNFIVTAAVLGEWVRKYYQTMRPMIFGFEKMPDDKIEWILPEEFESWITDTSCFRNEDYWIRDNITDCLSICHHVCNASKHFHWNDGGSVTAFGDKAQVRSWAGYFFDSTTPGTYVTYEDANYSMKQMHGILLQFYKGLIPYLEERKQEAADN